MSNLPVEPSPRQLWRRIAFSIAIHNTDDHLRNHGFLRHGPGWRLAPAFDVNPNPDLAAQRVTTIGGATGPVDEVDALLTYAESFDVTDIQARTILREVAGAAANWEAVALSSPTISRLWHVATRHNGHRVW